MNVTTTTPAASLHGACAATSRRRLLRGFGSLGLLGAAGAVGGFGLMSGCSTASSPAPGTAMQPALDAGQMAEAARLRDLALADATAWRLLESLTTEIGPRLAGSEADARAVQWAQAQFAALGYDKVWLQPVTFPLWRRRSEHGEVVGPSAQRLHLTALGGSPGGTFEGEVVRFDSLAALQAAAPGSLRGKVAFVDVKAARSVDGSAYGVGSRVRFQGPVAATKAGAIGFVMRSAGTDEHRWPHTGATRVEAGMVPCAALGAQDAAQLARLVALRPTRIRVALDCGYEGQGSSHNVIGEVRGASRPDEVVMLGAHLDSWDLGTGAVDDGAGVAITMAAGHLIARRAARPARTIRVVAFAAEEIGLIGGDVYAKSQKDAVAAHQIVAESDVGADRIITFGARVAPAAERVVQQIGEVLTPLGVRAGPVPRGAESEADLMAQAGAAYAMLTHDATHYFDLHHTAEDTLDKVDPKVLQQNVAAYTAFAWMSAASPVGFGSGTFPKRG